MFSEVLALTFHPNAQYGSIIKRILNTEAVLARSATRLTLPSQQNKISWHEGVIR